MRHRPTAFEVSFPDDQSTNDAASKRKLDGSNDLHANKRLTTVESLVGRSKIVHYCPKDREVLETAPDLHIPGEDPEAAIFGVGESSDKPIRILTDFSIFWPRREYEMVSLTLLGEGQGATGQIEAAGRVMASVEVDEDAGQEDEDEDAITNVVYLRLGPILRWKVDYTNSNGPFQIETDFAWYQLRAPSSRYLATFKSFYLPHRVTQLIISSAKTDPNQSFGDFMDYLNHSWDPILGNITSADLVHAVPYINSELVSGADGAALSALPLIQQILSHRPSVDILPQQLASNQFLLPVRPIIGNPDLAVLRPDMQNPTRVTPLIARLASGLFRAQLIVVGPRPPRINQAAIEERQLEMRRRVRELMLQAIKPEHQVSLKFCKTEKLKRDSWFYKSVDIDNKTYSVGDYVLVPKGQDKNQSDPILPMLEDISLTATIPDFFWIGKIIFINSDTEKAHLQWLSHGSNIHLMQICNPQELFLVDYCDSVDVRHIVGKVIVHQCLKPPVNPINHGQFFYKLVYNDFSGSFTQLDHGRLALEEESAKYKPPNNCHVCLLAEKKDAKSIPEIIKYGISQQGIKYHIYDFVYFYGEAGPCEIGYIIDILMPHPAQEDTSYTLRIRRVGRINALDNILPEEQIRDVHHLFMTNEISVISSKELIGTCYVWPLTSHTQSHMSAWLSLSPHHFYTKFCFPSLHPKSWEQRKQVSELTLCKVCTRQRTEWKLSMTKFVAEKKKRPLRTLDLFAGAGAFGLGMEETGCIKITHAVEIAPSAAETLRRNAPGIVIYNQCANIVLQYVIKAKEGHAMERPKDILRKKPLPAPFDPENIDCIIAGFPCQPHSVLNMWKQADDPKSNSILTTLSYVDFIRPKWAIFENVRGFLQFNLKARQSGRHRVVGGVEMGGVKFLEASLIELGYQVQVTLMQSGHYGTPQRRNRFFLFAALIGHPLPSVPQPTHDFPQNEGLAIRLPNGGMIQTIRTMRGTAPYRAVTIDDAISDLPRFDWKDPARKSSPKFRRADAPAMKIPILECDEAAKRCGFEGQVAYLCNPQNNFQAECRRKQTKDLQQYTRVLVPAKVERVVNVPLRPGADYRDLPPRLFNEWQISDPFSAVARDGFRPGLYGRLDKDSYFPTTVTNMDPTAKQSRVLNPYCKRMLTVRELARSQGFPDHFVFYSMTNDVVTMHRQIGNAVSWPVARAIGMSLRDAMFKEWQEERADDMQVD